MGRLRRIVKEAAIVAGAAVGLGFVANAVSEKGITLSRDHFAALRAPSGGEQSPEVEAPGGRADSGRESTPGDAADPLAERIARFPEGRREIARQLLERGFQVLTHDEVVAMYEDELFEYGAYVFVDARTPAKYAEGHIPRALLFDHFHFEKYIDRVWEQCQGVAAVVVYCYGEECTDSEIAARMLIERGVDPGLVKIYIGGIQAWKDAGLPLVKGGE